MLPLVFGVQFCTGARGKARNKAGLPTLSLNARLECLVFAYQVIGLKEALASYHRCATVPDLHRIPLFMLFQSTTTYGSN